MASGPLWRFAERISASRREGKNRRDGATVQTRVLGLVDLVAKGLWDDAAAVFEGDTGELEQGGSEGDGSGGGGGAEVETKTKSMRKRGNMAKL